jgi:acetolactate synthase-1/2/3 large subunit
MHQEREYPGRVSGSDVFNPDFAAMALAFGWRAATVRDTDQFEAALAQALQAGPPMLIHLKLDADVSTSRSTLGSIREAARRAGR